MTMMMMMIMMTCDDDDDDDDEMMQLYITPLFTKSHSFILFSLHVVMARANKTTTITTAVFFC